MAYPTAPSFGTRRLLVYPKHAPRGKGYIILPEIRLHGRWLEAAGFTDHMPIRVSYERGMIMITPDREPRPLPVAEAMRPQIEQLLDTIADLPDEVLRKLPALRRKHRENK